MPIQVFFFLSLYFPTVVFKVVMDNGWFNVPLDGKQPKEQPDSWLLQFNLQSYSRFTNNKNDFSTEETNWKGINIIINCSQYIDAAWVERYWKIRTFKGRFEFWVFTLIILILRLNVDCWANFSGSKFIDLGSTLISFSN